MRSLSHNDAGGVNTPAVNPSDPQPPAGVAVPRMEEEEGGQDTVTKPRLTAAVVRGLNHVYPLIQVNLDSGEGDLFTGDDEENAQVYRDVERALEYIGALASWHEARKQKGGKQ